MIRPVVVAFCLIGFNGFNAEKDNNINNYFSHIRPKSADAQRLAALSVIKRTIPAYYTSFNVIVDFNLAVDGKDHFRLLKNIGTIDIYASSGVAAVWGFHFYLKEYCKKHIGWQVRQLDLTGLTFPTVNISVTANDRFRYYQNVCTVSYSFIWWNKSKWRYHIDWMAMNGINLALAPHGQEMIWMRIYKKLGLTDEDIREEFSGPAFLAWQRMGNIRAWGGPLNFAWLSDSLDLQHFIVNAMTSLGIVPVLPSFSGYVPRAFKRIFPNAAMTEAQPWNRFKSDYCCPYYLDPSDGLFASVGIMFLSEMVEEFGKSHVYNADPFNEMLPTNLTVPFIRNTAQAIYSVMSQVDAGAIWLLQNWFFVSASLYWTRSKAEAFLTSVPQGKLLVLDLQAEQWPQYGKYENYFGQPYIWCMLHNFGGTLGLYGNTNSINNEVYRARYSNNSTMVGIGLTPEGINQNYALYDLMLETAWRHTPVDLMHWAESYASRRYGVENEDLKRTWRKLFISVYDFRGLNRVRGKYVITRRPSLNIKPWAWYRSHDLMEAWKYMLNANINNSCYYHDLVDISRQALQYRAEQLYIEIVSAFKKRDSWALSTLSTTFMNLLRDLTLILSSNLDFSAYNWIKSAATLGKKHGDQKNYIFNARNQITLWGPNGEITDYANKQWAEIVEDYYAPRWKTFLSAMLDSLSHNYRFNETAVQKYITLFIEAPFSSSFEVYPYPELGNVSSKAWSLYRKWSSMPGIPDIPIKIIQSDNMPKTDILIGVAEQPEEQEVPSEVQRIINYIHVPQAKPLY